MNLTSLKKFILNNTRELFMMLFMASAFTIAIYYAQWPMDRGAVLNNAMTAMADSVRSFHTHLHVYPLNDAALIEKNAGVNPENNSGHVDLQHQWNGPYLKPLLGKATINAQGNLTSKHFGTPEPVVFSIQKMTYGSNLKSSKDTYAIVVSHLNDALAQKSLSICNTSPVNGHCFIVKAASGSYSLYRPIA